MVGPNPDSQGPRASGGVWANERWSMGEAKVTIVMSRRMVAACLAAGAVAVLAFSLFGTARAEAAMPYTVVQCFDAHQVAQGSGVWDRGGPNPGKVGPRNNCGGGGGLGTYTTAGGAGNGSYGVWSFVAPAGAYIAKTQVQHLSTEGNGWQAYYKFGTSGDGIRNLGSVGNWAYNQYNVAATSFGAFLQCKIATCSLGAQHLHVRRIWFDMVDQQPPRFASLGGPLIAGGTRHGRENLVVGTSDQGSGLRAITVSVNGAVIRNRDLLSSCATSVTNVGWGARMRPCPASDTATMSIQTDDAAGPWQEGANSLQVCVRDYSGHSAPCQTRTVVVDNSCPSSGAAPAAKLDAGVRRGGALRSIAWPRSNQDVHVAGTLKTSAGSAVNDGIVCVYQTDGVSNATPQLVRTLRTKNGGQFGALLDRGPSRNLRFVYRYNNVVLQDAAAIRSRVLPAFKIKRRRIPNGAFARFRGRLPGPANDNRVVAIQVRLPKKWRTFKNARTNQYGRFRAAFHFTSSSTFRYTFRAVVRRQRGYPYMPGASRKRRVLVIGR